MRCWLIALLACVPTVACASGIPAAPAIDAEVARVLRSEPRFPQLVRFMQGDTGVPYDWEYGTQ